MSNEPSIVVLGFETKYHNGKEVDYVTYAPRYRAQTTQIVERVDSLKFDPSKFEDDGDDRKNMKRDFMRFRWEMISKHYDAWKNNTSVPEDGTPLGAWAGCNSAQADVFRKHGITSVELLAEMPDGAMSKIPLPGVTSLRDQARIYLGKSDVSDLAKKNADLSARLDAAMSMLEDLAAKDSDSDKAKSRKKTEAA